MKYFAAPLEKLVEQFESLPGIGHKTAQRLAFHVIRMPKEEAQALADAIISARTEVRYCKECGSLADDELCPICADSSRDHSTIMVVEDARDMAAYERTRQYKGVYHILSGVISPLSGVNPQDLKIKELLDRLKDDTVKEIVIAAEVVDTPADIAAAPQTFDLGIIAAAAAIVSAAGYMVSKKR